MAQKIDEVLIDLEKEPLMVFEESKNGERIRGITCVRVYAELLRRGYEFPTGNVFLRKGIYHLTGYVGNMNLFEFGQHHRAMGHLLAKKPFRAMVWNGPGRTSSGEPFNPNYYPLKELRLTEERCPCGGYSFWDYVRKQDAIEIAEKLRINLNLEEKFLDG